MNTLNNKKLNTILCYGVEFKHEFLPIVERERERESISFIR